MQSQMTCILNNAMCSQHISVCVWGAHRVCSVKTPAVQWSKALTLCILKRRISLSLCASSALILCIVGRRIRLSQCAVLGYVFLSPLLCHLPPLHLIFSRFFFMCFFSFLILQSVSLPLLCHLPLPHLIFLCFFFMCFFSFLILQRVFSVWYFVEPNHCCATYLRFHHKLLCVSSSCSVFSFCKEFLLFISCGVWKWTKDHDNSAGHNKY